MLLVSLFSTNSGYNDNFPDDQSCYGPVPNCIKVAASKYCGTTKNPAARKCTKEYASGNDQECEDDSEQYWDIDVSSLVEILMAEQRRDVPNPYNYYCGL